MNKIKVHHNKVAEAFELQTNEKPVKLVAAVFHQKDDAYRLNLTEAEKYAYLFAAAPALLETANNFREWWANHFEDHDQVSNGELLCLDNDFDAAIALAEKEG